MKRIWDVMRRAWVHRHWYDTTLLILGLFWIFTGLSFYILVSWVEAPLMPYVGLVIASLGFWIGLFRPLWAATIPPPPPE